MDGKKLKMSELVLRKNLLPQELLGKTYGDYVITSLNRWRKGKSDFVEVKCKHKEDIVNLSNIKRGRQIGCKLCYLERNKLPIFKDQETKDLYYRVHSVFLRCYNKGTNGYVDYGGRGIKVWTKWKKNPMLMVEYLQSLPGYSLEKTIDRIDTDKNYEPGNLRWSTPREQAQNRRNSVKVNYKGEEMLLLDFIRQHSKLSVSQARDLYKKGWTLEKLATWNPLPRGNRVRFNKLRTEL